MVVFCVHNSKDFDIKPSPPSNSNIATKQQQDAGQSQIQLSHATAMNRYPDEYQAVREHIRGLASPTKAGGGKYKLLSFGSATGEEAITLATMYFRDDDKDDDSGSKTIIFGVDLHQESIDKAKVSWAEVATTNNNNGSGGSGAGGDNQDKVTFFNGKDTDLSTNGPYDAIFANSVLCYHGTRGVNPQSIVEKFPFQQFESTLGYLDANLRVGGVLAIVNTNYHFSRSDISKRYTPLPDTKCSNFVPKVDAETVSYETNNNNNRMEDCVWVKEAAAAK